MKLKVVVTRGSLLKIQDGQAVLTMSSYCAEDARKQMEKRAQQVLERLEREEPVESSQGIFITPERILIENFPKTKGLLFMWDSNGMTCCSVVRRPVKNKVIPNTEYVEPLPQF